MNIHNIIGVIDQDGNPKNPLINKNGFVKRMIESGEVKIISRKPILTIQIVELTSRTRKLIYTKKQKITLGIDYGYKFVGYSVISDSNELVGGTLFLRTDIPKLLKSKAMYRTQRRHNLRFRKARFDHRRIDKGWLPPSIRHDLDSVVKQIRELTKIFPIDNIVVETANFDIQKLNNPSIEGVGYQQGVRFGVDGNLREYILHRDNHSCKHKECKNKEENPRLYIHHIVEKSNGGSDSPDNLITLCSTCHTPANHKNGFLNPNRILGDKKLTKSFKAETHMNIIRKFVLKAISEDNPKVKVDETFGYITKERRLNASDEGIDKTEKTHHNDAFFIAGGLHQERIDGEVDVKFLRRNNRSLETFRDAKYIDSRDGKIKSGQQLSSQRTTRSKENAPENLRKFRLSIIEMGKRKEITKGKRSIRTSRYEIQKGTVVKLEKDYNNFKAGQIITLGGTQNKGTYACVLNNDGTIMKEENSKKKMSPVLIPTKICIILKNKKGITWIYQ